MKSLFALLALLCVCCVNVSWTSAQAAAASTQESIHHSRVGDMDIWIIATAWRDQPANVLIPTTEAQKSAIAKAYPQGVMHNALNVMLVRGKDYTALVDTGLPATLPALLGHLKSLNIAPEDISHVLITHAHNDHTGGLSQEGKAVFPRARVIISEKEYDFWHNPAHMGSVPDRAKGIFTSLPAALAPYAGRIDRVQPEKEFLAGLAMIAAYGHTPGHVGVVVRAGAGREGLLFWGDMLHGMLVQLPMPDVATAYDVDAAASVAARKNLLNRAVKEQWQVTGVHVPGVVPWPASAIPR